MKILLVSNLFHPDSLAGASLYTDMARYFRDVGHDIRVTCTFSYYPAWRLRPEDSGVSQREEAFEGILVKRIRMYVPTAPSGLRRILSDLSFFLSLLRRGTWPDWKPDVIITAEPMLSQCLAQRLIHPDVPKFIVVQDFVVDAALQLGIIKIPGLKRFLHFVERLALRSADRLSSISPTMTDKLRQIVGPDRIVTCIPNWIHTSLAETVARARQHWSHERNKRTLFYSGNVGVKQGLSEFIAQFQAADARGWQLRIHGQGAEFETLRRRVQTAPSVVLGNLLEESAYVEFLLTSSACLITQQPNVSANFLPSKILPALAAGTPILAICDPESPLGIEIESAQCGVVVKPGDAAALRDTLNLWSENPEILARISQRSREASMRFEHKAVMQCYERELVACVESRVTGRTRALGSALLRLPRCGEP